MESKLYTNVGGRTQGRKGDEVRIMASTCAGWTDRGAEHHECQFEEEAPEYVFGGTNYCRFHLPMGDPGEGGKADWNADQKAAISESIVHKLVSPGMDLASPSMAEILITNLSGVVVPVELTMSPNRVNGPASFNGAQFHGAVDSVYADFSDFMWFDEAEFHRNARFDSAAFQGEASFSGAQFHAEAEFPGADNPNLDERRKVNAASFSGTRFGGSANFSNREFLSRTDFTGAIFEFAPNFHGSTLHQDTAFGDIDCFRDVTSDRAADAYRTLRLAMEEHRARLQEGMFFALEQKARRRKMKRFNPAHWLSFGYELGSNYGLSILRPLLWFAGGIIISTFLLFTVGFYDGSDLAPAGACPYPVPIATDALLFSVRQTFLPFDALRTTDKILTDYAFNLGGTDWLRAWGVVLSLFEALAALLLILAVRWRYRR